MAPEFGACDAFFSGSDRGEDKGIFGGLRHGVVGIGVVDMRYVDDSRIPSPIFGHVLIERVWE